MNVHRRHREAPYLKVNNAGTLLMEMKFTVYGNPARRLS